MYCSGRLDDAGRGVPVGRAEAWRSVDITACRHAAQPIDSRRGDSVGGNAVHAHVQQPRVVRSAHRAEQVRHDRAGTASAWKWSEDGTILTFTLRPDVKWHD